VNLHIIEEEMMDELSGDFDHQIIGENQVLVEALQMHYSNKKVNKVEIQNENQLVEVDFKILSHYEQLRSVNFSMNSIVKL